MKKLSVITFLFMLISLSALAQSQCRMLFYDKFDDQSFFWAIKKDDMLSYSIKDGHYYVECFQRRRAVMTMQNLYINEKEDFEIETSIRKETKCKRNGYGIIFGYSNIDNYYCFLINDKGEFRFSERKDGEVEYIVPRTDSEYINKSIGTSNKLLIKKEGEEYKLYVNDSIIAVKPFRSLPGNSYGIYVQRKQRIAVDYFRVLYSLDRTNLEP